MKLHPSHTNPTRKRIVADVVAALCLTLAIANLAFAEEQSAYEDIIYLGAPPAMLRLNVVVDGKPWHETRNELAKRQFQLNDTDHDGLLELDQLYGVPLPKFDRSDISKWDGDSDGKLSESEFLYLFTETGEPPFLLAEGRGQASSRVKLFSHLDTNADGKLTEDEFEQARHSLARLDYDDDETISTAELTPFANPLVQQAFIGRETPLASDAPFVSVGAFESISDVAIVMLRRYGNQTSANGEEQSVESLSCDVARLGTSRAIASFDADKNGQFNHAEMTEYLTNRKPDIELDVELPSRRAKRPRIKLVKDRVGARKGRKRLPSSRLSLMAGQTSLDMLAINSRPQSNDNRSFYLAESRRADENKNGYIEASEFAMLGLNVEFENVDLDGDEKIIREELIAYIERDSFTSQSQVVLSVAADTKTLFSFLDKDYDQRLTLREFKDITSRLKTLDGNRDNMIEASEIAQKYRLSFSMGRPRIFQQAMMQQNTPNNGRPSSQVTPSTDGPEWFRKMDRNQDGDLSWREFLGKRETFENLDADSDGLVTVAEIKQKQ